MIIDFGYGVDISRTQFVADAAKYTLEHYATKDILDEFEDYCKEYEDLVEEGIAESCFVEDYMDDVHCVDGIEAILIRCINDNECHGKDVFLYDDYCIYVGARIPANDDEKAELLTTESIRTILAKYLNPILTEPVSVKFLEIRN